MSLLSAQGGRTSTAEKSIKEGLLNEEIAKLREVYQDSSAASEKVLAVLRKIIAYHKENPNVPFDDISTLNHFMEDLSSIEDSFISLIENCEADRELFVSSVIFRDSDKQLTTNFFRKMIKSHEDFKEKMNESILRLQKDIQALESNGYHIYQLTLKPNNVMSTLKKQYLEKFIISLSEMHVIFTKMKAQMSKEIMVEKRPIKSEFKNQIQRFKECCRVADQICMKEKLQNIMMTEEINKLRGKIVNETNKIREFEDSIKMGKRALKNLTNELVIQAGKERVAKNVFVEYILGLKQKTDGLMIFTPKLYKPPTMRSKSCHVIIQTQPNINHQSQMKEERSMESETQIIGSDFLQETLE